MNQMPLDQLTKVIKDAFNGAAKITKSFQTFFIETMILYLSIPKRIATTRQYVFYVLVSRLHIISMYTRTLGGRQIIDAPPTHL